MSEQDSWWRLFVNYFKSRPWLLIWIGIFTLSVVILALAGKIHIQGDGHVTIYEVSVIVIAALIWCVAKFVFKTDLTEEYLLGTIFGIQWEFLTWAYWTYLPDRFNVLVWEPWNLPLIAIPGWGTTFALTLLLSNQIAMKVFNIDYEKLIFDWRVLICDAIAIQITGVAAEWTYGILLGCWKYDVDFGIGKAPTGLGWEIHIGYAFAFFWYATTMRVWKRKLEGTL